MADPSEKARPHRVDALLSIIGGGLITGAFFLPNQVGTPTNALPPAAAVISMWDVIYRIGSGTGNWDQHTQSFRDGQPHLIAALLAGLPMLLGALIVVLGLWSLVRRSGELRAGFFGAAVVLTAISAVGYTLVQSAEVTAGYYNSGGAPPLPNEAWIDLGTTVLLLGLLLVIAAGCAAALRRAAWLESGGPA